MSLPNTGFSALRSGITLDDLRDVIKRSGYPLQASVSATISSALTTAELWSEIQEEWAYVDSETQQIRSIDLFAEIDISPKAGAHSHGTQTNIIKPQLNLLIECKHSELPYVFFLREQAPSREYTFPEIYGLPYESLSFRADQAGKLNDLVFQMSLHDTFAFWDQPYFDFPAPYVVSISKVARKGPKLELTGEEAYKSLTLPLVKAADHLRERCTPREGEVNGGLVCHLVLLCAVLRAPMFGVFRHAGQDELLPMPWFRVSRLEPASGQRRTGTRSSVRYYDVVHEDYLSDYLNKVVESFSTIGARLVAASEILEIGAARHTMGTEDDVYKSMSADHDLATILKNDPEAGRFRVSRALPGIKIGRDAGRDSATPDSALPR